MNIKWTIDDLERRADNGFVVVAHWRAKIIDNGSTAEVYGSCSWVEGTPQVAFDSLTEDIVLQWVWEQLDREEIETNLQKQVEKQKRKAIAGVPWAEEL